MFEKMDRPENNFDLEKALENFQNSQLNRDFNSDENLSVDKTRLYKQQLKRIVLRLVVYGLVAGVIASIGAVVLLERFGLTNRLNNKPLDTQPQQQHLPETKI